MLYSLFQLMYVAHEVVKDGAGTKEGKDHWILQKPFVEGRFKRKADDALCKSRSKFWSLQMTVDKNATCPQCQKLSKKYKLSIKDN